MAKQTPEVYVVMHTALANFVRGCRITTDHLYHPGHPTRDAEWQRLIDLGAIKPEGDPEAAAVPETQPASGAMPIIFAGAGNDLTPQLRQRNAAWGIAPPANADVPPATTSSRSDPNAPRPSVTAATTKTSE